MWKQWTYCGLLLGARIILIKCIVDDPGYACLSSFFYIYLQRSLGEQKFTSVNQICSKLQDTVLAFTESFKSVLLFLALESRCMAFRNSHWTKILLSICSKKKVQ